MHRTSSETSALPYIAAGTVAVLLLGLLTAQLLVLHTQYKTARKQLILQAELVRPVQPLLHSARDGELHATVEDLRAFLDAARPLTRDAPPALRATRQVAEQTLDAQLVPRLARATARVDDLLRRSSQAVGIGRDSLAVQRQSLTILQQSMDIQRQTLAHAESVDRKTGGTAPPTAPVAAPIAP
jgi:hypothetical protein